MAVVMPAPVGVARVPVAIMAMATVAIVAMMAIVANSGGRLIPG